MNLYYYTTSETMRYILTNGDIYATHVSYLNDSDEYINGLRELRYMLREDVSEQNPFKDVANRVLTDRAYENESQNVPQIFSISFTQAPDLLSQWYMYSKESGVRLKFRIDEKEMSFKVKQKKSTDGHSVFEDRKVKLQKVRYFTRMGMDIADYTNEKQEIFNMIEEYMKDKAIENNQAGSESDLEGNLISIWKTIAPYIKNYEFRQEEEMRLVFRAEKTKEDKEDFIGYRNSKGVLIPYLDIYMEEGWPVTEIMIGPGRNQERVFRSICHFVENASIKIPSIDQQKGVGEFIDEMSKYQISDDKIAEYKSKINALVKDQNIITYKDALYESLLEVLKNGGEHEREYLNRNYYSKSGIIVRKSNAPYEF